ncbi:MAG: hypothetical protein QOE35_1654 [Actinomycetota bacterium]|jgi:hypothetical protein
MSIRAYPGRVQAPDAPIDVSVVLPCLDEAASVGRCVQEARLALADAGLVGEVIVADNGSADGSADAARAAGAVVVDVPERGYGCAVHGGMAAARGEIIVMADADSTYDLSRLTQLIEPIRHDDADLVLGSRLGDSTRGAMPPLHRYLGTPILTFLLRRSARGLLIADSQTGYRALRRDALERLQLRSLGMELASEMLIRAAQAGLRIIEVDVGYRPRVGPSKLEPFSDARRHLRLIVLLAPHLLLTGPGAALLGLGVVLTTVSLVAPAGIQIGSLHWQPVFFFTISMVLGVQAVLAGTVIAHHSPLVAPDTARHFAFVAHPGFARAAFVGGIACAGAGAGLDLWLFLAWTHHDEVGRSVEWAGLAQAFLIIGPNLAAFGLLYPLVTRVLEHGARRGTSADATSLSG